LGLFVIDPDPDGLTLTVSVYWFCVKFAVTVLLPLIVTVTGFVVPLASPLQLPNVYPAFADAVSVTTSP
jgi:hypothetical protein